MLSPSYETVCKKAMVATKSRAMPKKRKKGFSAIFFVFHAITNMAKAVITLKISTATWTKRKLYCDRRYKASSAVSIVPRVKAFGAMLFLWLLSMVAVSSGTGFCSPVR